MDGSVIKDATLMQRIQQLEQERDELRLDVEQLCVQHSGMPSKADMSQIQARRITGLEKEMELWKQKLQTCNVKNQKLQDELTEAKQIKVHFADLLEAETKKNLELGKEIKFFQSEAATALVERDRALYEVERCLEEERNLVAKVLQLERRLELLTSNLLDQEKSFQSLQDEVKKEREDSIKLHNVVQFFWKIRSELSDCEHALDIKDKATVLLQEPESSWAFGNTKKEMERLSFLVKESGSAMAALQEEVCAARESVIILEKQLEEENLSKQYANQCSEILKQKLLHLTEIMEAKLRSFRSEIVGIKEEITTTLREEESWADSLMAAWVSLSIPNNPASYTRERSMGTTECKMVDDEDTPHEVNIIKGNGASSKAFLSRHHYESEIRDTKEALGIALEEKVAALLLLSQQDERGISKENMIAVRERKIAELHKQLLQVTIDKGDALIQVANLTEELVRVQGGHWPSKSWFKVHNNMGFRSKAQFFHRTRVKDDSSFARLQDENNSLWSILSNLHKLCSSVNRLHQALVKVRDQALDSVINTGSDESEQLDFVICEAQRLIVAATDGKQIHVEIMGAKTSVRFHASDCQGIGTELLSTFGRTSLEAILLAAEICKSCLNKQRHC